MNKYRIKYLAKFLLKRDDGCTALIGKTEVEAKTIKKAISVVENGCTRPYVKREVLEVKLI